MSLFLCMVLESVLVLFSYKWWPVFPAQLVKEAVFFPLYILASFVEDKVTICSWIYLWPFYSVPLIYTSVFVPAPYHSSVLAWKIPWTEEPGGFQSVGSQKSQTHGHDWATNITERNPQKVYTYKLVSYQPCYCVLRLSKSLFWIQFAESSWRAPVPPDGWACLSDGTSTLTHSTKALTAHPAHHHAGPDEPRRPLSSPAPPAVLCAVWGCGNSPSCQDWWSVLALWDNVSAALGTSPAAAKNPGGHRNDMNHGSKNSGKEKSRSRRKKSIVREVSQTWKDKYQCSHSYAESERMIQRNLCRKRKQTHRSRNQT